MEEIKDEIVETPVVAEESVAVEAPAEEVIEAPMEAPAAPEVPVDQGEIGG